MSTPIVHSVKPGQEHTLSIEKLTFGVGDRFAHQAKAQLRAFQQAAVLGIDVTPVWNKSNREHGFVGSQPPSVKAAAEKAVKDLGWTGAWHVDADHINLSTVGPFLDCSDFFTIDVADFIGDAVADSDINAFVDAHGELIGELQLPGMESSYNVDRDFVTRVARQYLGACKAAGEIYRHIADIKGENNFIAEVSMDETDSPQTPPELLVIVTITRGTWWPRSDSNWSKSTLPLKGCTSDGIRPSAITKSRASAPSASMFVRVVSKWVLLGTISPDFSVV